MRRRRQGSGFGLILPLFMPKSLILPAKGFGFGSYALEFVKQEVLQSYGLDAQTNPGFNETSKGD